MGYSESNKARNRFKASELGPGIVFRHLPESKWKTLSINVFCIVPVLEETLTPLALVPRLARRGTQSHQTAQEMAKFLEEMYGAGMGADARKVGPTQVLRFGLDIPSPKYLDALSSGGTGRAVVSKAVSFLWEVVTKPYLVDGAYFSEVFEMEKNEHRRDIIGMINNRPSYAIVRMVEELSKGDPRGLPAWGSLKDLATVNPKDTWEIWKDTLARCPISIYAVGEGADEVGEIFSKGLLEFPSERAQDIWDIRKELDPPALPKDVLFVEDSLSGAQTILCMAFHTGIREGDPALPALLFFDGILGGFPHSKLFSVVRERESLAYFADTSPNTWRGLIMAIAGISDENKNKVQDLIAEQVEVIRKGVISESEMDNTRVGLVRRLKTESDSQGSLVKRLLNHEILGGPVSEEELVQGVMKVTKQDVIDVASKAELRAVYALRAKG